MDHEWAAEKLKEFHRLIDAFYSLVAYGLSEFPDDDSAHVYDSLKDEYGSSQDICDRLTMLNPVMRTLMDAANLGLGDYLEPPEEGWLYEGSYWREIVKPRALRAIGIHELGEEARHRTRPD